MELQSVAFIGRTMDEYVRMFGLDATVLGSSPVLDCPGGAASFTAEASARGFDVTASDILYDRPPDILLETGRADIALINEKVRDATDYYRWDMYGDVEGLIAIRQKTLELFREDFGPGRGQRRYVAASLPLLPFRDGAFELVLCSHFLFLYGKILGEEFQSLCLEELVRVSSHEVRVYPLRGFDQEPCPHLEGITQHLRCMGHTVEQVEVPFEFFRGSNAMLSVKKRKEPHDGKL